MKGNLLLNHLNLPDIAVDMSGPLFQIVDIRMTLGAENVDIVQIYLGAILILTVEIWSRVAFAVCSPEIT